MRFFRFVNSWESIDNNITQTSSEKYNQKVTGETSKCKIHENETVEKEKVKAQIKKNNNKDNNKEKSKNDFMTKVF